MNKIHTIETARCFLCQSVCYTAMHGICQPCSADLAPNNGSLCRCGLPFHSIINDSERPLCGRCLHRPPAFSALHAPYRYQYPLNTLLPAYKYRRRLDVERALFDLLPATAPGHFDAAVPIPLHWRRHWWRGFNQAHRLAHAAGARWDMPVLSCLRRQRPTRTQQGMSAKARAKNISHAFSCVRPVHGLRLLLIDDVVTTGATVSEASQCLLAAGAQSVEVWALARTLLD